MHKLLVSLSAVTALALIALPGPGADAQRADRVDRRALAEAWGPARNLLVNRKDEVEATVNAIRRLEGLMEYAMAIELLNYFDECDMAWDASQRDPRAPRGAARRPKEAYRIANAMLEAVRKMPLPDEVAKFADDLRNHEKFSLRPRMAMLDALAYHAAKDEACMDIVRGLADTADAERDTDMRILAIAHLGEFARDNRAFQMLLLALQDRSWRVRDAAIDALVRAAAHRPDEVILALINALATERGKLRLHIALALKDITRADNGTDADAWADWYRRVKRSEQGLPPPSEPNGRGTRPKRIFETETFSDRFIFVIDSSVSMLEQISPEEKERLRRSITGRKAEGDEDPREPLDWTRINCKLDLAREEIIRTIKAMDPERVRFTMIAFDRNVKTWKEELVPTNDSNVAEATRWLRDLRGGNQTNLWGAIDAAYDLSEEIAGAQLERRGSQARRPRRGEQPTTAAHRDEALPDTIFVYTDGYATFGKYAGDDRAWASLTQEEKVRLYSGIMREMTAELEDRNRLARITVHCIGVGTPQDSHTMRNIVRVTRGQYTPIGQ
jgi:hypothetical protein